MSTPPPQLPAEGTPWAEQWIEDAGASLPEAPPQERPACAARLAAMLFACGRDEEGEAVLSAARREAARAEDEAGIARIEIAFAGGAVTRDDEPRARGHLATGRRNLRPVPPSIRARAWLIEVRLARAEAAAPPPFVTDDPEATQEDLLDPSERIDLGAEVSLERAVIARHARDWNGARILLERARELASTTSSPRLIGLVEVEIGLYGAEVDDARAACERIQTAIELLHSAGLKRDEGRAMIALADLIARKGVKSAGASAAEWLARAEATLGEGATWRDRAAIEGTSRRPTSRERGARARSADATARLEAFERARGVLLGGIATSVEAAESALNELEACAEAAPFQGIVDRIRDAALSTSAALVPAVGEVDRLVRDLIDALDGALGERDRLRAGQEEAASSGSKKTARIERTAERIEERAPPPTLPSVPGEEVWVPEPGSFDPRAPILPLLELEKKAYLHALDKSNQSVARAAEALGVSKVTFYAKLRSWGMHPRDRFDEEGPTNVRRARMSSVSGHERTNEPFEPPTRTSSTKIRTEK